MDLMEEVTQERIHCWWDEIEAVKNALLEQEILTRMQVREIIEEKYSLVNPEKLY